MIGWINTIPIIGKVSMFHYIKPVVNKNVVDDVARNPCEIESDVSKIRAVVRLIGNGP